MSDFAHRYDTLVHSRYFRNICLMNEHVSIGYSSHVSYGGKEKVSIVPTCREVTVRVTECQFLEAEVSENKS